MKRDRATPFESRLEKADDSEWYNVEDLFLDDVGEFFDDGLSNYELFFVVQSYLWNNDIGRLRRFQSLYTFFRSTWVLLLIATLLHALVFILSVVNLYPSIWSSQALVVITFTLVGATIIAYRRRIRFHQEMVKSMIYDFYANVITSEA